MHNIVDRFYLKTEHLSRLLSQQGISVAPYKEKHSGQFLKLDDEQKIETVQKLSLIVENYEIIAPAKDYKDPFSKICQKLNLEPVDKSVYKLFRKDHVWEIVDFEINQIFRNQKIYETVSYTLEELETYSPWVLYKRPEKILEILMKVTEELKSSEKVVDLRYIPSYIIQEILPGYNNRIENSHEFACALRDCRTGKVTAFVSALTMQYMGSEDSNLTVLC